MALYHSLQRFQHIHRFFLYFCIFQKQFATHAIVKLCTSNYGAIELLAEITEICNINTSMFPPGFCTYVTPKKDTSCRHTTLRAILSSANTENRRPIYQVCGFTFFFVAFQTISFT